MARILDDRAPLRRHPHRRSRMQEEIGRRLAVLDVVAAEEPITEAVEEAGLRQVPPDLPEIAARRNAGGIAVALDRVNRLGDAVDRLEVLRRCPEIPGGEIGPPRS